MFLRFDRKKHRPLLACEVCGTYIFHRTPQALTGLAILTPLVEEMYKRMHSDPRFAEEQRRLIAEFNMALLAAMQPSEAMVASANGASFRDVLEQAIVRNEKKVV